MEGRIGPENDTLVQFLDLDGDPNEGHHDEPGAPPPKVTVSNKPPQGDLEPEVTVDMQGEQPQPPPVEEPPPAEPTPPVEEPPAADETAQAASEETVEDKKKSPWQRNNELRRELAEQKRLHQEALTRAQAAEQNMTQMGQRLGAVEQYLQRLTQPAQPTPQQPTGPQVPNFEENPLGNLEARQALTERQMQEINQNRQVESAWKTFTDRIEREEALYAQQVDPGYYQARDFLLQSAMLEGKRAGMSDEQIGQTINAYRLQIANTAWSSGRNISEVVKAVAEVRGYRPPASVEAEPVQETKPNGLAPKAKVQQAAAREQQAAATLAPVAKTPGRPPARMTREMVLSLTEQQMDELDRQDPNWMDRYMAADEH